MSYVTVVRNGAATLERTLASVREQTGARVEHIVIDGQSDDGTLAIIESHAETIDYYASEPDGGLYAALNKAIPLARGELICVLNADVWLTGDAAALVTRAHLQAGPAPARLLLSEAWAMDGQARRLWSPAQLDRSAYLTCANICHNGVYATRAAYEASGPYATHLRIAADFAWLMACCEAGVGVVGLPAPTVHYSMGGMSNDKRRHTADCAQILHERFAFLNEAEAWGLMHAFHQYRENLQPFAATRPPHLGRFLAQLARKHRDDAAFNQTLALAATALLRHPEEADAPARLTRQEKTRRSLHRRWMRLRALLG